MYVQQALNILGLATPFTLAELKSAYRKAALKAHPDCGGTEAEFIKVDNAYDLLKSLSKDEKDVSTKPEYWVRYWEERLKDLESTFRDEWKKAYKQAKEDTQIKGIWYSTVITRFTRAYMEPKPEWFNGCLFNSKSAKSKQSYREFLLSIAPNQKLREAWAMKYYKLEFGEETPWTFYLAPSKQAIAC